MALTGLAIVGFLFLHAIGNLQYWLGPDAYNTYAAFLQAPLGLSEILWLLRIGLFGCLILHIISAVYLRLKNNAAKPVGYQIKNYAKAKLTSRTMLWTGLLVLAGVTFHILHFTSGTIGFENGYNTYEAYPTGEFVMPEGGCPMKKSMGCPDKDASCKPKDGCCKTEQNCKDVPCKTQDGCCKTQDNCCKTEQKCSDKPCQQVASKSCSDACPPGNEMCGKCKANPEQCSKNQMAQTGGCEKPCQAAQAGGCDKPCQAGYKNVDTSFVSCCKEQKSCSDKPCQAGKTDCIWTTIQIKNSIVTAVSDGKTVLVKPCKPEKHNIKSAIVGIDNIGFFIKYAGNRLTINEYTKLTSKKIPEKFIVSFDFIKAFILSGSCGRTTIEWEYINEIYEEIDAALDIACKEGKISDFLSQKSCQTACKTECCDKKEKDCKSKSSTCCKSKSTCCKSKSAMPTINNYKPIHPGAVAELRHDVYGMVGKEFANPWVALAYIIFVILVGFHLNHAIQSGIHTLGIEGPKFTPVMRILSTLLSIGLVMLFILLPLGVLANVIGLCNCIVGGL